MVPIKPVHKASEIVDRSAVFRNQQKNGLAYILNIKRLKRAVFEAYKPTSMFMHHIDVIATNLISVQTTKTMRVLEIKILKKERTSFVSNLLEKGDFLY